jgi:hypothetical protein
MSPVSLPQNIDSKSNQMSTTKKMSIFVLQPNTLHVQWQGEKLNSVFQVREYSIDFCFVYCFVISYLNQVILNHI